MTLNPQDSVARRLSIISNLVTERADRPPRQRAIAQRFRAIGPARPCQTDARHGSCRRISCRQRRRGATGADDPSGMVASKFASPNADTLHPGFAH